MKVHLAGISGVKKQLLSGELDVESIFALESFYSLQEWQKPLLNRFASFLLDSGAFTFMQAASKHGDVDWLSYADQYADFIRDYGIRQYFELDIDSLKGLKYAEMLRNRIENRVGWQSIPVWHTERGKDYFLGMVKDYKYVALGSIAKVLPPKIAIKEKYFPWFIGEAHKTGCRLHALGYTNLTGLKQYHFDSVDSTTWTVGSRYGQAMVFEKGTIKKVASVVAGVKVRNIKDTQNINYHNFCEWLKYQRYADINL